MLLEKKKGIISLALAGCILFTSEFGSLAANPLSEAQAIDTITHETHISPLASVWETLPELAEVAVDAVLAVAEKEILDEIEHMDSSRS